MRISTKGRYALRVMIDLACNDNGAMISLRDISERQGITLKYLEQIVPLLRARAILKAHGAAMADIVWPLRQSSIRWVIFCAR